MKHIQFNLTKKCQKENKASNLLEIRNSSILSDKDSDDLSNAVYEMNCCKRKQRNGKLSNYGSLDHVALKNNV